MSSRCKEGTCAQPPAVDRTRCEKHLEYRRRLMQRKRREDPRGFKSQVMRRLYGITEDDYDAMLLAQGGVCGLCSEPETVIGNHGKVKRLAIDHDHETGEVRGLLCNNCNRGIGFLRDDPDLLMRAAEWVARTRAVV